MLPAIRTDISSASTFVVDQCHSRHKHAAATERTGSHRGCKADHLSHRPYVECRPRLDVQTRGEGDIDEALPTATLTHVRFPFPSLSADLLEDRAAYATENGGPIVTSSFHPDEGVR